jgi:hypothetical protein
MLRDLSLGGQQRSRGGSDASGSEISAQDRYITIIIISLLLLLLLYYYLFIYIIVFFILYK